MASKLTEVLALVETKLTAAVPGVTYLRGAKFLNGNGKAPRVVWVHTRTAFGAARNSVPRSQPAQRTALTVVEAHLWATGDTLENLEHQLVLAALAVAKGSVDIGESDWTEPEWMKTGEGCVVSLAFHIPVTEAEYQTVPVEQVAGDSTGAVQGDGTLECGEQ
jgi:hypothetical protein